MPKAKDLKAGTKVMVTGNCKGYCGLPEDQTGWKGIIMYDDHDNAIMFDSGVSWCHSCDLKVIGNGFEPSELIETVFKKQGE